jgi:hypothetical protein
MKRYAPAAVSLVVFLILCSAAFAQSVDPGKSNGAPAVAKSAPATPAITANSTPTELAAAALAAQGGDKFKNLKSMILQGSANLYAPNSSQSLPGRFVMVTAGEKVRIDIDASPVFKFKQVFDGQQSYSSMPNVSIPPASKFGLPVLAKYDQPGYTVSALADKKKLRGFRIVDAEGNTSDFYMDPATGRITECLTPYNGYNFGTSYSKFAEVEGVLIPMSFTQRLEMPQGAFFAEYKVKDVKLNQPVGDDVFVFQ